MLIAAPLDLLIRFSDVDLLSAEVGFAFPADNPAAECIPALIDGHVLHALSLPAVFINLPHGLRLFSGNDRLVIIGDQVLGQFSMVALSIKGDYFRRKRLLQK